MNQNVTKQKSLAYDLSWPVYVTHEGQAFFVELVISVGVSCHQDMPISENILNCLRVHFQKFVMIDDENRRRVGRPLDGSCTGKMMKRLAGVVTSLDTFLYGFQCLDFLLSLVKIFSCHIQKKNR